MSSLWIKRIAVVVISLAIGYVATLGIVHFILNTVMSDYGLTYIVLTIFTIGCGVAIWLDKFLKAEILPE